MTFTEYEWLNAVTRPKIVHFTDKIKPWHIKCNHPLSSKYVEYQHINIRKTRKRLFYNVISKLQSTFNRLVAVLKDMEKNRGE